MSEPTGEPEMTIPAECMTLRGVQAVGSRTVTSTMLGTLRDDARSRAEFLAAAAVGPK